MIDCNDRRVNELVESSSVCGSTDRVHELTKRVPLAHWYVELESIIMFDVACCCIILGPVINPIELVVVSF